MDADEHSYVYIQEVNEHLICPVCRQPFLDPVQTPCGHLFCSGCIAQVLQTSPVCPIDRSALVKEDITPAPKVVGSLVNELLVRCPRSCGVDVERASLDSHLKGRCELEQVPCVCGSEMTRRERRSVIEGEAIVEEEGVVVPCVHEWLACPDCPARFERRHRSEHLETCPNQQSTCQHCHITLPQSHLLQHNQECPSYPLHCPHSLLGCPHIIPRSQHPQHLTTCPFTPLSPLLTTLLSRLSALERQPPPSPDPEIDRLRTDLNYLSQVLGDLEMRFSNAVVAERIQMGEEVERLRSQVGALRRDVWFSRRREWAPAPGLEGPSPASTLGPGEITRRLSDSITKQNVKL